MSRLSALVSRHTPAPLRRLRGRLRGDLPLTVVVHADDDSVWFLLDCIAALAAQRRRPRHVVVVVTATPDLARALVGDLQGKWLAGLWRLPAGRVPGEERAGRIETPRTFPTHVGQAKRPRMLDTPPLVSRGDTGSAERLEVIARPGADRVTALTAAVQAARYDRVLLLDAGERLPPDALARLHAAEVDVVGGPGPIPTGPLLWRRPTWLRFGPSGQDRPWRTFGPQADAILAGATSVSLPEPVLTGRAKGTGQGFTSVPVLAPHVSGFVAAARRAATLPGVGGWLLRTEVPRYLRDAERCNQTQREELTALARELAGAQDSDQDSDLGAVPVEDRVRIVLAREDRWDDLVAFNTARWRQQTFPVRVDRGRAHAILPADVPADLLAVPPPPPRPRLAAQQLMQQWHREAEIEVDPGLVLFQSYQGAVTDSPAAIERVLARTHPGLRRVYAVAPGQQPPEGCAGVEMRTKQWYRALSTAGAIVTNVDLEPWFFKRPGQRVLQTYHGMPSKAMGISAWRGKGWTDSLIENELRRTSGTWDLLVTATPEMEQHYREQYRYDGPVLAHGYPRDDDLVVGDLDRRRARVRKQLGIGTRTAVLYAPTWRDDLAATVRDVPMPDLLDLPRTAADLGEEFVLLVRGHRFHRASDGADNIVDVTGHPEINDLILASDAAVLDYSSLRFDFSLTGRPMVFLVPDLDRYASSSRGFLYPFAESAPGPLLATSAEVVESLRDLPGVRAAYASAYARFAQRFNAHQDGHAAERAVAAFFS